MKKFQFNYEEKEVDNKDVVSINKNKGKKKIIKTEVKAIKKRVEKKVKKIDSVELLSKLEEGESLNYAFDVCKVGKILDIDVTADHFSINNLSEQNKTLGIRIREMITGYKLDKDLKLNMYGKDCKRWEFVYKGEVVPMVDNKIYIAFEKAKIA